VSEGAVCIVDGKFVVGHAGALGFGGLDGLGVAVDCLVEIVGLEAGIALLFELLACCEGVLHWLYMQIKSHQITTIITPNLRRSTLPARLLPPGALLTGTLIWSFLAQRSTAKQQTRSAPHRHTVFIFAFFLPALLVDPFVYERRQHDLILYILASVL
jgi:hypothetical protein